MSKRKPKLSPHDEHNPAHPLNNPEHPHHSIATFTKQLHDLFRVPTILGNIEQRLRAEKPSNE